MPPDSHSAAVPRRRAGDSWVRALTSLTSYVPLVVMGLLALFSWWLVKNAPMLQTAGALPAVRHLPDYTMEKFMVQRFHADGSLKARIEGDEVRHYPDTDTLEVENARIRAISPDGRVTVATARRAVSNADASEVQLQGGARVVRQPATGELPIEFRGEFLHAFLRTERVRSHLPVIVQRGAAEVRADTLDIDHLDQLVNLKGRVRATFAPRDVVRR